MTSRTQSIILDNVDIFYLIILKWGMSCSPTKSFIKAHYLQDKNFFLVTTYNTEVKRYAARYPVS